MTYSVGAGTTRSCGRGCSVSSCGSRSSSNSTSTRQGTASTPARYAIFIFIKININIVVRKDVLHPRGAPCLLDARAPSHAHAPRRAPPPRSESLQRRRSQVEKLRHRRACPPPDPILLGRAGGEPPRYFRESLQGADRAAPGPPARQHWPARLFTTSQLRPGGEVLTCARRDLCFVRR